MPRIFSQIVWRSDTPEKNDALLASATTAALEIAGERGLSGIAFAAISPGIFGFPEHRCAEVMIGAVVAWAAAHPTGGPRDLRFTIIDDPTLTFFEAEMERRFGKNMVGEDES